MTAARPKIKIMLSASDRFVENLGYCLLVLLWILTIASYFRSPEIVPIHFNASGNADGFGSRINILFLSLVPTVIFFGLGKLIKYPHVFNYPVEITRENAVKQYTIATKMIRALKTVILLVFIIIILFSYFAATQVTNGLGVWTLPLIIILLLSPTVYYVYRSFKVQ